MNKVTIQDKDGCLSFSLFLIFVGVWLLKGFAWACIVAGAVAFGGVLFLTVLAVIAGRRKRESNKEETN